MDVTYHYKALCTTAEGKLTCKIGEISSRKTKHCLRGMDTIEDPPLLDKL